MPLPLRVLVPCLLLILGLGTACHRAIKRPPLVLTSRVDLPRFMGDWYVIANIPTILEKGAHNAVESYRLEPDGTIATTFTFRADAFDGPVKRYTPRGFVQGQHGAVWGMQFLWPFKADYRIVYLSDDYQLTMIGREARDHVWIMARRPTLAEADYQKLLALLAAQGYDTTKVQRVPQRW